MSKPAHHLMTESGFLSLRAAVVRQACDDYLDAVSNSTRSKIRDWFLSENFLIFCDMPGKDIVKRLEVLRKREKRKLVLED